MSRVVFVLLLISIAVGSCESLPAHPVERAHPQATAVPQDGARASGEPSLDTDASILVGRAFHGGWYDLYFTDPADPAGAQLIGGPDGPLVAAIDAALLSVDVAVYSFSLRNAQQALIRAHRRGVTVRIVMESDNIDRSVPEALKEAGIPLLGDRREGLMHNKFVVIDRTDVWTGSMNLTADAAYLDRNNLLHIHSAEVAADYLTEFNEMFVDDKFGTDIVAATPYPRVIIEGTPLDIYFSPDDHVQAALLDLLDNSTKSIYFLAYSFTADPLSDAIQRRAAAGVTASGVMDAEQVASNAGTEYDALRTSGIDVRLDGDPGLMHHKVMIIDRQIVVLGSYNFTASAEKTNDENLLVLYSPAIAAQFLREFQAVFAAAQVP